MNLDAFRAPPAASDTHHSGLAHGDREQEHGA